MGGMTNIQALMTKEFPILNATRIPHWDLEIGHYLVIGH
jgi:hypothetical protein